MGMFIVVLSDLSVKLEVLVLGAGDGLRVGGVIGKRLTEDRVEALLVRHVVHSADLLARVHV
jgi:hypothetical protein